MSLSLRPYQRSAINGLWDWFSRHPSIDENPIVGACVGAGKSVMIAASSHEAMTRWPGTRIVVVQHQKELLQQNADKMHKVWPDAPIGIWSAALNRKQIGDITFATIGSIYKHAHMLGQIGLLHADESHMINPKEIGMWRNFIADVRQYCNPRVRIVGWTGTPFRGNGVWLTANDESLFTGIAARVTMKELLEQGYLAPLLPAKAERLVDAEAAGIGKGADGDFNERELAEITDTEEKVRRACDAIVKLGREHGRKRWLVFAVNVEHARHVNQGLLDRGVKSAVIVGDTKITSQWERNRMIGEGGTYRTGELECLVNVGVATTGFDVPEVDFIALLRDTNSPVMYVQICGRGMRVIGANLLESIDRGKADCLFADFTSTVERLGPVDAVTGRMPRKGGKKGAPFRICPTCSARCKIQDTECPDCGHKFPEPEYIKHADTPTGQAMLSSQLVEEQQNAHSPIQRKRVTKVSYLPYTKPGSKPCIMVSYFSGLNRIATEWVHIEQRGMPRDKAEYWWAQRTNMLTVPSNVSDALEQIRRMKQNGQLKEPLELELDMSGKYPEIKHVFYTHTGLATEAATRATKAIAQQHDAPTGWQLVPPPGPPPKPPIPPARTGAPGGNGEGNQRPPPVPTIDQGGVSKLRSLSKWSV